MNQDFTFFIDAGRCDVTSVRDSSHPLVHQIIQLHRQTFPSGLLSNLGDKILSNYYHVLIQLPTCGVIACHENMNLLGFITFTCNNKEVEFQKYLTQAKIKALQKMLLLQLSPLIAIRAFIKAKRGVRVHDMPELTSIAISPSVRRLGLGKKLLNEMEREMLKYGITEYCVYTDNEEGLRFYQKYKFENVFQFDFAGITSACFKKKILLNDDDYNA